MSDWLPLMKHFAVLLILGLVSVFISVSAVLAQDAGRCSALVQEALDAVADLCDRTGSDELCYGNTTVSVTSVSDSDIVFSDPGDIISINQVQSVQTTALKVPDEWGVSLMRIRANIPNTLPGQVVTFLLFGDIELENAVPQQPTLSASTTGNINIRSGPSTGHSVAGGLSGSTPLELQGRNAAGDWVYFTTEDATSGWLFASLLEIEGDVMMLDEVPDDYEGGSQFAPMQVIYFTTGVGLPVCSEAPQDGILIQTPNIEERIELVVNDAEVRLGSTAYLQAQASGDMTIYIVEGEGRVRSADVTQVVPAGAFTTVPLDANGLADGPPTDPQPYDATGLLSLPLAVMDRQVALADPATEEAITEANTPPAVAGDWTGTASNSSTINMTITALGGDQFSIIWTEPCFPNNADPGLLTMEGEGSLVDNMLRFDGRWSCNLDPADLSGDTFRLFEFDPDADILIILERGQDDPVFTRLE